MKQTLPVLAISALLSADAWAWSYSTETDSMDSSIKKFAELTSDNSLNLGFPYSGENRGELIVRQQKQYGLNVIFRIKKGQLICNSYEGCRVNVRFDDAQPVTFSADGPADHSSNVLFLQNSTRFIELAKKAKHVRVAVTVYQAGTQVLEFSTDAPLVWDAPKANKPPDSTPKVSAHGLMMKCNTAAGDLRSDERKDFMTKCLKDGMK
jgi:psiF repeat